MERFQLALPAGTRQVTLRYQGTIRHSLQGHVEDLGKVVEQSPGTIGEQGVFLSGASGWYPAFGEALLDFSLRVDLPQGWDAVSQGRGPLRETDGGRVRVRWEESSPQDDIYLIAAPFHAYQRPGDIADAQVYLREPDPALAERYLEATARYLALYSGLLGPYPYAKFALVENFWETGFGMPSFTLLGPRVIRLPFILESSYPHEILHNWWGNSVYIDYASGNWSEGLTAYLADHLLQEDRGAGAGYRRNALQKYAEYAAEHKEFPLTAFRARHDETSQVIGYNKAMMLFHMLRMKLGDEVFLDALRRFYRDNRFHTAGYVDLQQACERSSGIGLSSFFRQWVDRAGAPALRVSEVGVRPSPGGFRVHALLEQTQAGAAYQMQVPLAVVLAGGAPPVSTAVWMAGKRQAVDLELPAQPLRLEVDPLFDLFRRLDPGELPPTLDRGFAAERVLLVVPTLASKPLREAYLRLAEQWARGLDQVEVRWDNELQDLPAAGAVWLLGWENRFFDRIQPSLPPGVASLSPSGLRLAGSDRTLARSDYSLVLVGNRSGTPTPPLAWLGAQDAAALPGLTRKLPHYGKYSYLAFSGAAPEIQVKGQWTVSDSPLSVALSDGPAAGAIPDHPPLSRLAARPTAPAEEAPRSATP
jgi:hypothetical protein